MEKEKILTNEGVKKVEVKVAKPEEIEDQDLTIDKVETEDIEIPSKVVPSKEPEKIIEEPRNPMKEDITKPRESTKYEEPKPSPKEKKDYIKNQTNILKQKDMGLEQ